MLKIFDFNKFQSTLTKDEMKNLLYWYENRKMKYKYFEFNFKHI